MDTRRERVPRSPRADSPLRSFPPIARRDAVVLVLGTMPGTASLAAGRYYAHPRNAFWDAMAAVTGVPRDAPYARRCAGLRRARIALWDVAGSCRREGSLDTAIEPGSVQPNDIAGLLRRCPRIRTVVFNGSGAERLFRRHVLPGLDAGGHALRLVALPSTSPAHAACTAAAKRCAWLAALSRNDSVERELRGVHGTGKEVGKLQTPRKLEVQRG